MLKIVQLPVGQLKSNCYLVTERDSGETIIVDPGEDADFIHRKLADSDLKPSKIIATHGHYDHVLAVLELKLVYKIPFLMHEDDEFLLENMSASAKYYSGIKSGPIPKIDKYLEENDILTLGKYKLKVIHTPGHTPGSISIYNKNILLVGDLIFERGAVGRTDFSYSDNKLLRNSIKKILTLPNGTIVYSGHGEKTKIGVEKKYHLI